MTGAPEATVVGVYRRRNAAHVLRMLEPALRRGWTTGWWALDGVDPTLADYTVGEGPGDRFPLVNETLRLTGAPSAWTLVCDDDIEFRQGDIVRFLGYCTRAGLDIAQPARHRGTSHSHPITSSIRFVRVRHTTFVESGPLFAVGPRFRDDVLPLPADLGMGWGVEFLWYDLVARGAILGIVDATTVVHLGVVGDEYETASLHRRLEAEVEARGVESFAALQRTLDAWRPWQRRPAWLSDRDRG